jgi:cell division protein FtsI/penicillin-binding protein 2
VVAEVERVARQRALTVVVAALALFAVAAAVMIPLALHQRHDGRREAATAAAASFARAWPAGDLASVHFAGTPAPTVATQVAALTAGLAPATTPAAAASTSASPAAAASPRPAAVTVIDVAEPANGSARGHLKVRWALTGGRSWEYTTAVDVRQVQDAWAVVWSPTLVHPALTTGHGLVAARTTGHRGRILGAGGQVLAGEQQVVNVGIEPGKARDAAATAATVAGIVDVDAGALAKAVTAATPTAFVPVITLRAQAYQRVSARLKAVPGVVTTTGLLTVGRTAQFARALLGSVGPGTKEIVAGSGGRVRVGDLTGLAGLQRTYDEQLSGAAGLTVTTAPLAKGGGAKSGAAPPLFTAPATNGADVTTTLDPAVQDAAQAALAAAQKPAGLVAVRPSTGEVLAVANGGPNAAGYDRALLGQYPPGSTFKVASGYALLRQGYTATTPVACPASLVVNGQTFTNAEGEVLGTAPFRTNFAQSCNTAFVGSAPKITPGQLADAASELGYGRRLALGVQAFAGSVPSSATVNEHAADMIGQGKVLASPLTVATVSASVAAGTPVVPRLVVEPKPAGSGGASGSLDGSTVATLRQLMRAVVTEGTGTALRGVPGGPVYGKTGTAEFGSKNPPDTHAWFTGYQGDLAFAVVVEGGGFGAKAAAPLAADFLRRLDR